MRADQNNTLPTQLTPTAINFTGHVVVSGVAASNISIVVNGEVFPVDSKGNFSALIPRRLFLDASNQVSSIIPVDFWDLSHNIRYQETDSHEQYVLSLPAEWQPSGMTVYSEGTTSPSYKPSPAFYIKRDFNLVRVN